jgi:hypothetical protein
LLLWAVWNDYADRTDSEGAHMTEGSTDEDRRGADRRRTSEYKFNDRRSGFDRRTPRTRPRAIDRMLIGLSRSTFALVAVLVATNILNLADLGLTLHLMQRGAQEANPVMGGLFAMGPATAILFKAAILAVVTLGMWGLRRHRLVVALSVLTLAGFAVLVAYELLLTAAVI